jgi:hypothetical protein
MSQRGSHAQAAVLSAAEARAAAAEARAAAAEARAAAAEGRAEVLEEYAAADAAGAAADAAAYGVGPFPIGSNGRDVRVFGPLCVGARSIGEAGLWAALREPVVVGLFDMKHGAAPWPRRA